MLHSSQANVSTLLKKLQGEHRHLGRGPTGTWHRRQVGLSLQFVIWQVSHSHSGNAASGCTPAASQAEFSSWAIHRTGMLAELGRGSAVIASLGQAAGYAHADCARVRVHAQGVHDLCVGGSSVVLADMSSGGGRGRGWLHAIGRACACHSHALLFRVSRLGDRRQTCPKGSQAASHSDFLELDIVVAGLLGDDYRNSELLPRLDERHYFRDREDSFA